MTNRIKVVKGVDQDGMLRFTCEPATEMAVRVAASRNGAHRYPVELLWQDDAFLTTDSNLRHLPDIEALLKHTDALQKDPRWHAVLTAVAKALPASPHVVVRSMDEIEEQEIAYVWNPYVALGKLCLLDGDPGSGKTGLVCILAAAISRGYPMPDQAGKPTVPTGEPGVTLLVSMEDDLSDTIKKRLRLIGADPSRIKVLDHIVSDAGKREHFTLDHVPLLEEEVIRYRPRLVYVDSLQLVLGPKVDMNRANQVADALEGLIELAARYHFALICARHPAKPGQNIAKLIHRGMGSVALIGRARLGLFVEEYPGDPTRSMLVQSKANGGMHGRTQLFSKAGGKFEWCGVSRITKDALAGGGRGPSPQAFLECCLWLERRLGDRGDSFPAKDLRDEAEEEGFGHNVLIAARKALGVSVSQPTGTAHGGWYWRLPPLSPLMNFSFSSSLTTDTEDSEDTEDTEDTEDSDRKTRTYSDSGSEPSESSDASEVSVSSESAVLTGGEGEECPVAPDRRHHPVRSAEGSQMKCLSCLAVLAEREGA
jgi:hypothetical protein